LEAKNTVVRLDKNYRPVRISEDMKFKILNVLVEMTLDANF